MIRVADYIIDTLYNAGAEHIFFVPGSGCMFLTDALARKKDLVAINMNHEQAAGMAALAYAQVNKKIGACLVTTGCGGTNAITALLHAWQDNIPCVFISGQAERNHTIRNSNIKLRQFGRQETDIIAIVESISKYAVMINDPKSIVFELEKAIDIATTGRKGPVWLDIPLDVQSSIIDIDACEKYDSSYESPKFSKADVDFVAKLINESKRPIILAGNGINIANANAIFRQFITKYDIPVVHSRLGCDVIPSNDIHSIGMIGMLGASRSGNFAVQNADLVVAIGCRLSINTTSYEYEQFVREGKLIVIDIDEEEHKKNTVKIDKFIHADAKEFLEALLNTDCVSDHSAWLEKCIHWKHTLPILLDDYRNRDKIDMYDLAEEMSAAIDGCVYYVSDAGDGYYIGTSGICYKDGQRAISSAGQAEMGFALPGAIGASFATDDPIFLFVGDGSFMMNLQELATVSHYNIPLKIVLINNNGYSCIRKLHQGAFRRHVGCDPAQGLGLPDFGAVAKAFGISYKRVTDRNDIRTTMQSMLEMDDPCICEVICTEEQQFLNVTLKKSKNKKMISSPLEDQAPFLPRELFDDEMIITPIE